MSKILKIGNSYGVTLDPRTRAEAGLKPGDEIVTAPVDDGIYVARKGSRGAAIVKAAKSVMSREAGVFAILKDR
jgi:antitoxin component of MazEF toxin-antitoxin module